MVVMNRNTLIKNKLDLEYSNCLNWRNIIFAFYSAILAVSSTYYLQLNLSFERFLVNILFVAFLSWGLIDFFKYDEIKNKLKDIENKIEDLSYFIQQKLAFHWN